VGWSNSHVNFSGHVKTIPSFMFPPIFIISHLLHSHACAGPSMSSQIIFITHFSISLFQRKEGRKEGRNVSDTLYKRQVTECDWTSPFASVGKARVTNKQHTMVICAVIKPCSSEGCASAKGPCTFIKLHFHKAVHFHKALS
jgi:hypothetical protein